MDRIKISSKNTLILGIGNSLLSDEGIGIHVLNALQDKHPDIDGIEYLDGGTLSFSLAGWIEEADRLIVIDAANFHQAPGTIRCLHNEEMDIFLGLPRRSVHEVSLLDLLDIARLTECLPEPRVLIGIQAEKVDWGEFPGPAVAAAIPKAIDEIEKILGGWQQLPTVGPASPSANYLEEISP
jgi:hydrogenase maturation protease